GHERDAALSRAAVDRGTDGAGEEDAGVGGAVDRARVRAVGVPGGDGVWGLGGDRVLRVFARVRARDARGPADGTPALRWCRRPGPRHRFADAGLLREARAAHRLPRGARG